MNLRMVLAVCLVKVTELDFDHFGMLGPLSNYPRLIYRPTWIRCGQWLLHTVTKEAIERFGNSVQFNGIEILRGFRRIRYCLRDKDIALLRRHQWYHSKCSDNMSLSQ